jgi:hypothetical protein
MTEGAKAPGSVNVLQKQGTVKPAECPYTANKKTKS